MKCYKILLLVMGILWAALNPIQAQNTSTQGKEFWLTFMHNGFKEHPNGGWVTNQVLISAKRDCSGAVSNPQTGWSQTFSVNANSITTLDIPLEQGYHNASDHGAIQGKAIYVTSSDTISVYCTNIANVSFDASFVLPYESLGNDYIIQCYDQSAINVSDDFVNNNQTSAFAIVATEDNTVIDITPSCATLDGKPAGETYQITMNAGETYHVRSVQTGSRRDLSGTRVTANDCKKIAVFNGNTLTCIPANQGDGFDHIFEQAMPLRSWGKRFIVTSSLNRNRDFVKITSSADNNAIYKNGTVETYLNANESYIFGLRDNDGSCFIQTEHPCAVYLYNNSCYDGSLFNTLGDPSMVWIAPVEQKTDEITFSTFNHETTSISIHCINIIINTDDINNVYLDGQPIPAQDFQIVAGNDEYSYARKNISHGSHHISCSNGFNAHVYGFGRARGYAYLVGSNAIDLSTSVSINDVSIQPEETYQYCAEENMTFQVDINTDDYTLQWDFGDGASSNDNPASHIYQDNQIFPVTLTITTEYNGCWLSEAQASTFFIDLTPQHIIENDEICVGDYYSGYGFDNVLIYGDTLLTQLVDNTEHPECKDYLQLYITAHPTFHIPISDSRCWQGEPGIYEGHGFAFEYDAPGEYDRQLDLMSINGCDSSIYLHLTINDMPHTEWSDQACSEYSWNDSIYNASGDYTHVYSTLQGCDSIVTLHLTINDVQHTEWSQHAYNSFTWNDSIYDTSGDYVHTFTSMHGCDSIVTLHLDIEHETLMTEWSVTACDSYEWNGITYDNTGEYTQYFVSQHEGDSIVTMHLTINNTVATEWVDYGCYSYEWNGVAYDTTGEYTQVFNSHHGCDSIVTIHLTIGTDIEGTTDTVTGCNSYNWYEQEYTEPGFYTKVFPSNLGCDSTLYLHLDLEYTPNPTEIMPADASNTAPHWVVTATEFQINTYDFTLEDNNPACRWDSIQWAIDTPEAQWILEPDTTVQPVGKTCKLFVLNSIPDTIWIHATVYNKCQPQGVERRYWLLCSFYSIDEQDSKAQFEVIPNPNNGTMDLLFEHLYGKNDIKVYNMKGALIDHFETYNSTENSRFQYTMKPVDDGLYFFVVSGKNSVITKKIIIIH